MPPEIFWPSFRTAGHGLPGPSVGLSETIRGTAIRTLGSEEHPAVARFFPGPRVRRRRDRECCMGDRRHRRI